MYRGIWIFMDIDKSIDESIVDGYCTWSYLHYYTYSLRRPMSLIILILHILLVFPSRRKLKVIVGGVLLRDIRFTPIRWVVPRVFGIFRRNGV